MATVCGAIAIKGICSTIPRPLKEIKMADEHLHQTEAELSEFEQWKRWRDELADIGGGLIVESTSDSPEQILAAMFAPQDVRGPKVEIASRGVRTKSGGVEHGDDDLAVEDYREVVDGREMRADKRAFEKRFTEYEEANPGFTGALNGVIPEATRRVILQSSNGPAIAAFLSESREICRALCDLATSGKIVEVVARTREIGRDLDNMGLNLGGSYSDFRESRNRQDNIRRRPR